MAEATPQLITLAQRILERVEYLGVSGRKADSVALDVFVGAATGAELAGDADLANHIAAVAGLIISVRGMFEVRRLAACTPTVTDLKTKEDNAKS